MQPAKTRGYATCMVFGEGGRFVRDVGARFRSQDFKILLVYEPIRLQNRRRNCDLRACETFGDVRSQRKLPFMKQQLVRSQIAQERTRAAENAEVRGRSEEAEQGFWRGGARRTPAERGRQFEWFWYGGPRVHQHQTFSDNPLQHPQVDLGLQCCLRRVGGMRCRRFQRRLSVRAAWNGGRLVCWHHLSRRTSTHSRALPAGGARAHACAQLSRHESTSCT